jgi:Na+/melibiose symporter-like transporter
MILVGLLGGGSLQVGFRNTAFVYGIFALAVTVAAGLIVRERVEPKNNEVKVTLRGASRVVLQNRFLIIAMISSVLILMTLTLKAVAVPYYATYNLGNIDLVPLIMLAVSIPGLIGFIIAPKLVKLYGKRNPTLVSLLISVLFSFAAYFVGYHYFTVTLILQAIISFFMFIAMVIMTTMFADSVVYADSKFGIRTEGIIFSFRTLSGKIAAALATFASGIILTVIGYVADSVQTQTALNGLHAIVTLHSGIMMALCIIPLLFYNLTQANVAEMSVKGGLQAGGGTSLS